MKRFFNILPGKEAACILLYGEISDYHGVSSADVAREIIEAEAQFGNIDVRINSIGGEVYAGIAIFNAFRASKANITIYIDGIAASIASVIAACGKPVKMSRYARLMIHRPSGGAYGNVDDIKVVERELNSLEETLCEMYATRCHKTKEDIRAEWFDGKDHWFTAAQALELGLIDEVYDADPVPEDSTPEQVYAIFNNRLQQQPQNDNKMNLEELRKRPSFANCATDEDVLKLIDGLETNAAKVPGLEQKVADFEAKERQALEAEDDALLDEAEDDGRTTRDERPSFKALLKADRDNTRKVIKGLKPKKRATEMIHKPDPNKQGAWDKRQEEIRKQNNQ